MLDNKDYRTRLSRARRRRKGFPDWRILLAAGGAVVLLALGGGGIYYYVSTRPQVPAAADSQRAADTEDGAVSAQAEVSPEEEAAAHEEAQIQAVLDSYTNLGLVQVSGYLNIRAAGI